MHSSAPSSSASSVQVGDEYPLVCETCLGNDPYVRMMKLPKGSKLCKISNLPFQAFRWKAGQHGRYKETVVSFIVANEKNICQVCLFDMKYGLPVGVRDNILASSRNNNSNNNNGGSSYIPRSDVAVANYFTQLTNNMDTAMTNYGSYNHNDTCDPQALRQLEALSSRNQMRESKNKVAFRNLPKLCTFWLIGKCSRCDRKSCPYRPCAGELTYAFPEIASTHREEHQQLLNELKEHGPSHVMLNLSSDVRTIIQNALKGNRDEGMKKRLYGEDLLTSKSINKLKTMDVALKEPDDKSITTLWLRNITSDITENDIRDVMYCYGHILAVVIIASSKCAFVEYADRAMAEYAAAQLYNAFNIKGNAIGIKWAKPRGNSNSNSSGSSSSKAVQMLPPPGMEDASVNTYGLADLPQPLLVGDSSCKRKGDDYDDYTIITAHSNSSANSSDQTSKRSKT